MATGSRILELVPSQEEAIVARVLVLVHQAVDEHFPAAAKASRQFTKTVFSDDAAEQTAVGHIPDEATAAPGAFAEGENTSPDGRPGESATAGLFAGAAPPPPLPPPPKAAGGEKARAGRTEGGPSLAKSAPAPAAGRPEHGAAEAATRSEATTDPTLTAVETLRRDWQMILVLALLIAGLILLAYAVLN